MTDSISRSLYRRSNFILITKEDIQEKSLRWRLFEISISTWATQLQRNSSCWEKNLLNLLEKKTKDKHHYRRLKSYHLEDICKAKILPRPYRILKNYPKTQFVLLLTVSAIIVHLSLCADISTSLLFDYKYPFSLL